MQRIKRRRIYLLNILFLASVLVFYEFHANLFFRELAERQLKRLSPDRAAIETGGIPRLAGEPSLGVKRLEIDYRLWYPLIKKIPALAERHIRITQGKGFLNADIEKAENRIVIKSEINHIKFQNMDIVSRCRISVDTRHQKFVKYNVMLRDTVINNTPFDRKIEISLIHDKFKGVLNIKNFKVGNEIEGSGHLRLEPPNYIFLKWKINNLNLPDYILAKNLKEKTSGTLNGNFQLAGPLKAASLSADVYVQKGSVGDFRFESARANLRGEGPIIRIEDSKIQKVDSSMMLTGKLDLTKLKSGKIFEDVSLKIGT